MNLSDMSLFEAIHTQRSVRHFSTKPVHEEIVEAILAAAIRAPSAGNRQPWHFIVIRDRETKRRFGEWYLDSWRQIVSTMGDEASSESYRSGGDLARQMEDIPVLILACVDRGTSTMSSSIYPAVQNLMLAARALGLGTVLTTNHMWFEQEVKTFLGIPEDVDTAALIPVGYPAEGVHFGGSRRKPLNEVVSHDRWGRRSATVRGDKEIEQQ